MSDKSKTGAVLVIGGGVAGVQAALGAAGSDLKVYLVERDTKIGGMVALLDRTYPGPKCGLSVGCHSIERGGGWQLESAALEAAHSSDNWSRCLYCCTTPRLEECLRHPNIELLSSASIESVQGQAGAFEVKVAQDTQGRSSSPPGSPCSTPPRPGSMASASWPTWSPRSISRPR